MMCLISYLISSCFCRVISCWIFFLFCLSIHLLRSVFLPSIFSLITSSFSFFADMHFHFYQTLLLKEGTLQILTKVLGRIYAHGKSVSDGRSSLNAGFSIYNCCLPVLRSLTLICDTRPTQKLYGVFDWLVHESLLFSVFKYHLSYFHQ